MLPSRYFTRESFASAECPAVLFSLSSRWGSIECRSPVIGGGDLWVTELILTYDGKSSYTVSIMEFRGDKVARETQYFADPFVAPASRAQWVERMDA